MFGCIAAAILSNPIKTLIYFTLTVLIFSVIFTSCVSSLTSLRGAGTKKRDNANERPNIDSKAIVQRRVNVTEAISGRFVRDAGVNSDVFNICYQKSISNDDFDKFLSLGAKVISSSEWKGPTDYLMGLEPHYCNGKTYILEGPSSLFKDLYNSELAN